MLLLSFCRFTDRAPIRAFLRCGAPVKRGANTYGNDDVCRVGEMTTTMKSQQKKRFWRGDHDDGKQSHTEGTHDDDDDDGRVLPTLPRRRGHDVDVRADGIAAYHQ